MTATKSCKPKFETRSYKRFLICSYWAGRRRRPEPSPCGIARKVTSVLARLHSSFPTCEGKRTATLPADVGRRRRTKPCSSNPESVQPLAPPEKGQNYDFRILDSGLEGYFCSFLLRNVPSRSSMNACLSCSCVFITMGPYQATGSSSGLPETRRKRIPSSPAWTTTSSPRSKSTSDRLSASDGGAVSSQPTGSVGTASGPEALQNFPAPAKT